MNPSLLALFLVAIGFSPLSAQEVAGDSLEKKAAVDAITPWLQEIDDGDYDQSWSEASKRFQQAANKEQWETTIKNIRDPLGRCTNRTLDSAMLQSGPSPAQNQAQGPGTNTPIAPETIGPDGARMASSEYVVAQFNASFENLKFALETVTFVKEPDSTWRALHYVVKAKTSDAP